MSILKDKHLWEECKANSHYVEIHPIAGYYGEDLPPQFPKDIEKNEKTSHGLGDSITNHIVDKGLSSGICKHSQTSLLKSCLRKSTGDLIFTHTCVFLMLYFDTQMEFKEVICILFLKTPFTSKMK